MNRPLRILLVEDNPMDAQLILRTLQLAGIDPECECVENAEQFSGALEAARWDVILSDYQLPSFGGPQALEMLKASGREIPFIVISGTIGEDEAVAVMKNGATDYLLKDRLGRLGLAVEQATEQFRLRRERREAEEALRETKERFREVVENIEEVFWMTNIEKTVMCFVSSAYERIWGRTCGSLYAKPMTWLDAVHPDDRARVLQAALSRQAEFKYTEEYRIIRPDGTVRWISDRAFPVRNAEGVIYRIAGVATDITERKNADHVLRESVLRFQRYFELGLVGLAITSPSRGWVEVNDAACRILGYSREELLQRRWSDLTHPDDLSRDESQFQRIMSGEIDEYTIDKRYIRKDGAIVYTTLAVKCVRTDSGAVNYFLALIQDITERKLAEAALAESEKQIRMITNNIPALISYIDNNLRYRFVNSMYGNLFGMPAEAIIGKSVEELIGDESFARVKPYAERALAGERVTFENQITNPSGQTHYFIITYVPDAAPDGTVHGIYTLVTDITQLKLTQEALRKSEDQLRQSQKMEAIGQLAGGVAHDFNNQLSVILGFANILSEQIENSRLRRYAENICVAAKRSADLTQKLLVFARKGQAQMVSVDLHKILTETIDMLERSVDKRISIEQTLEAESTILTGNASQLQNALLNLGINARDAMAGGGTLTFATENVALDAEFCACIYDEIEPGKYLKLTVGDTGCGMTEDVKRHLFEPFFTTKPVGKGTGLGLASVYGTVKQHSGALNVSSEVGRGTRFVLYFPIANSPAHVPARSTPETRAHTSLRILIVDDEEILRAMLAYALSDSGHNVIEAGDGNEAMKLYEAQWAEIDLVILDMVMPGLSGHETFLKLKEINPAIKAVLSTGFSLNNEVQAMLDDGVMDFLQKPFEIKQLQQTILKVMNVKPS